MWEVTQQEEAVRRSNVACLLALGLGWTVPYANIFRNYASGAGLIYLS
jgi:hypothetical protein